MYNVKILADSREENGGNRITTFLVTYPRIVHSEMCRHRMQSRNTASSRAIPFEKMVKMVQEDPFIPIAWQKNHKGMQGSEYKTGSSEIQLCINKWLEARDNAIQSAKLLNQSDIVTKQLCNRLLEPFMWTTEIITATEWENFFELRCPKYIFPGREDIVFKSKKDANDYFPENSAKNKDHFYWLQNLNYSGAEIHIQLLAEKMWDAMNKSQPKQLEAGEWHIPFGDNLDKDQLSELEDNLNHTDITKEELPIKIATARCARTSYINYEGKDDYEADIKLHDRLLNQRHASPFEHCAKAMTEDEYFEYAKSKILVKDGYGSGDALKYDIDNNTQGWCDNFRGFISYRKIIDL